VAAYLTYSDLTAGGLRPLAEIATPDGEPVPSVDMLRLALDGAIPKEFLGQKVPEILHVQPTEGALVLFVRQELGPLTACGLLWKMVGLGEIVS
jgi:hypothetical protein